MIYIASPYSSNDWRIMYERYLHVRDYTAECIKRKEVVFSPIVNTHHIAVEGNISPEFSFWKEYNFHILALCEELRVLTLDGWKDSKGVAGEVEFADEKGVPVTYV